MLVYLPNPTEKKILFNRAFFLINELEVVRFINIHDYMILLWKKVLKLVLKMQLSVLCTLLFHD